MIATKLSLCSRAVCVEKLVAYSPRWISSCCLPLFCNHSNHSGSMEILKHGKPCLSQFACMAFSVPLDNWRPHVAVTSFAMHNTHTNKTEPGNLKMSEQAPLWVFTPTHEMIHCVIAGAPVLFYYSWTEFKITAKLASKMGRACGVKYIGHNTLETKDYWFLHEKPFTGRLWLPSWS